MDKRIEDLKRKLSSKEGDLKDLQDRFIDLVGPSRMPALVG